MGVKSIGSKDKGQALLIVLLVMAVALVLVLSIVSRSITDISETAREEESFRAFSAAEAGVEQALITGLGGSATVGNAEYSVDVGELSGGADYFNHPTAILSGNTVHVWFVGEDNDDGSLVCETVDDCFNGQRMTIGWGKDVDGIVPAIEVIVYYDELGGPLNRPKEDFSEVKVARAAYDPDATRRSANHFTAPLGGGVTMGDEDYEYHADIDFGALGVGCWSTEGCLINATVRILYNTDKAHPVGFSVEDGQALASQGIRLKSVGSVGEVSRAVEVYRLRPEIPSLFEVGLYSGGSIVK